MPDPHLYPLSVAGVGISLKTGHPLPVTERFRPFLTEEAPPGYLVEFREKPDLSPPEGPPLYRS